MKVDHSEYKEAFIHSLICLLKASRYQVAEWNLDIPEFRPYFYYFLAVWPWTGFI